MSNRVVCDISISADGFVAGLGQTAEKPFGDGPVDRLHAWMFETPDENKAEVDRIVSAGAFVMGRNMFGPVRGEWDLDWTGWWGENPPYHGPVFVLTHHPRDPLTMQGGTTFTFVTDGIESALDQARKAAGDRDVAIAGGAATVNQYLAAGWSTNSAHTSHQSPSAPANASSTAYHRCTSNSSPSGPRRSSLTSATAYSTDPRQTPRKTNGRWRRALNAAGR
jgi:dihydrofolate reductase